MSVTDWVAVSLVLCVFMAIALNIREIRRAWRLGSSERRRFDVAFYAVAALLLGWLIITGNGAVILNPNAHLK